MRCSAVLALASLLVAVSGCANPLDRPPSSERIPVGCGTCEPEIAELAGALEDVPGVVAVRGSRLTKRGVPVAYLSVGVDLRGSDVVSTDIVAVSDALAEAAWHSDVSPLDVLTLRVSLRNGYGESLSYAFGADRADYRARWGARPAGSEWSPVPPVDDDLEGCEVDGCHDLMRALARRVSGLPGVDAVLRSDYVPDTPTNGSSADVDLVVGDGVAVDDLAEQVAELVWRSEVGPIDYIGVAVETPGGGFPETVDFQIDPDHGRDHERLERQWGPRPVG